MVTDSLLMQLGSIALHRTDMRKLLQLGSLPHAVFYNIALQVQPDVTSHRLCPAIPPWSMLVDLDEEAASFFLGPGEQGREQLQAAIKTLQRHRWIRATQFVYRVSYKKYRKARRTNLIMVTVPGFSTGRFLYEKRAA